MVCIYEPHWLDWNLCHYWNEYISELRHLSPVQYYYYWLSQLVFELQYLELNVEYGMILIQEVLKPWGDKETL